MNKQQLEAILHIELEDADRPATYKPTNPTWKFSTSFPTLAHTLLGDLSLTNPEFTINTGQTLPSDFQEKFGYPLRNYSPPLTITSNICFSASFSIDPNTKLGKWLQVGASERMIRVSGPLEFAEDLPRLWLQPSSGGEFTIPLSGLGRLSLQIQLVALWFDLAETGTPNFLSSNFLNVQTSISSANGQQQLAINALAASFDPSMLTFEADTSRLTGMAFAELDSFLQELHLSTFFNRDFLNTSALSLQTLSLDILLSEVTVSSLSLALAYKQRLTIFNNPSIVVDEVVGEININYPFSGPTLSSSMVSVAAQTTIEGIPIVFSVNPLTLSFDAALNSDKPVDITRLITPVLPISVDIPHFMAQSLNFWANVRQSNYNINTALANNWDILGTGSFYLENPSFSFAYTPQQKSGKISAILNVGGVDLVVSANANSGSDRGWSFQGETGSGQQIPIGHLIDDLAEKFGNFDIPAAIADISIDNLAVSFNTKTESFTFTCTVMGFGKLAIVVGKQNDRFGVAFGLEAHISGDIHLPHIPLVGSVVGNFDLKKINAIATSQTLPPQALLTANADVFGPQVSPGISLFADLQLGSTELTHSAPLEKPLSPGQQPPPQSKAAVGNVGWVKINKGIGPVHFNRLGFGFGHSGKLSVIPDMTVALSMLEVDLEGLSFEFPLNDPTQLSLSLNALEISYTSSALSISGGFIHVTTPRGNEYDGEALIKAENFELGALGAFFQPNDGGPPSLFIFAVLEGELGGPPCFFVTGLAGGFGYNYLLKIPNIDGVKSFPLVAAATGGNIFGSSPQPQHALDVMREDIVPQAGNDWLAAGVRFTSFEMLDSFALLTVQFGTQFELALLGLTTLTIPIDDPEPIAKAQLALEVDFSTASGLLKVEGKLTRQSYILSGLCRLTGGFAFYLWFAGEHAGDFVITLGGYNPHYHKPAHYPNEPRIGYRWQISSALHIEGGMYFALTPSAVMAGGKLEATFRSGCIHAWFDAYADFLLLWKPFHYDADFGVRIGVSFIVHFLFVTVHLTVHLGVAVHLFGPSFGGTAKIDLSLLKITIYFGSSHPPAKPPIPWSEFATSFLPSASSLVTLKVTSGLVKQGSGSDAGGIVKPAQLELTIKTTIPIKTGNFIGTAFTSGNFAGQSFSGGRAGNWTEAVGVGPSAVEPAHFNSSLNVTVQYSREPGGTKHNCDVGDFILEPIKANAPTALWGAYRQSGDKSWLNDSALIGDALTGFKLRPSRQPMGHRLGPISIAELQYSYNPATDEIHFSWSPATIPTTDNFDQSQAISQLEQTLNSSASTRSDILSALHGQGVGINTNTNVSQMAQHADTVLLAPPLLSLLGENRKQLLKIVTKLDSNKVIDVAGANTANGTQIQVYESNETDAQSWFLQDAGNGYHYIVSKLDSNKVLNVTGSDTRNGTQIVLWDEVAGATNELWQLQDAGNGYYYIASKLDTNKVLNVYGSNTDNGTNIILWDKVEGSNNELWQLKGAS